MNPASPEAAVQVAHEFLEAGDTANAVKWLQRAARLATNATISLMLASTLLSIEPAKALEVLHALIKQRPSSQAACISLIAAFSRLGRYQDAAKVLADMLMRMWPSQTDTLYTLSDRVCAENGSPGWIGLDGVGMCHLRLISPSPSTTITIHIDGVKSVQFRIDAKRQRIWHLDPRQLQARRLEAYCNDRPLLGSGLSPAFLTRTEGFATLTHQGDIAGWARIPADEEKIPKIFWQPHEARKDRVEVPLTLSAEFGSDAPDQTRWRFNIPSRMIANIDQVDVVDSSGRSLWGSPLQPHAERLQATSAARDLFGEMRSPLPDRFRPLPVDLLMEIPRRPSGSSTKRGVIPCDIIVPVYAGSEELETCLTSLIATVGVETRIILVNDGSPEPTITDLLDRMAARGMTVLEHATTRGFPAAVNTGLRHLGPSKQRDVIILNSDTIVPPQWIQRLSKVAHSDATIGSCTPLTSDGTIVSYPLIPRQIASPAEAEALNSLCWKANGLAAIDIPTGVGFCMLLKGACLQEVGVFREDVFAQGYGEENDWCLRAAHLSWRHVAAPGIFVAHSGGRSFGPAKALLMERNSTILERLHPGYHDYVASFMAKQPLADARRRIDCLAFLQQKRQKTVAIITHNVGGGVARHIRERCRVLAEEGIRVLTLSPGSSGQCKVALDSDPPFPLSHIIYNLPIELPILAGFLSQVGVCSLEVHHLLNHDPSIIELTVVLDVEFDIVVHDYGFWCPRVSLLGRANRYCGEPLSALECEECVADLGSRYEPSIGVDDLRDRSRAFLQKARQVIVPSDDVKARIRRQFPTVQPIVRPWEADLAGPTKSMPPWGKEVHVVLAGAFGAEKGYDVLLACARDAARRDLPLRFTVVGHTIDDDRLLQTDRVFVTGWFAENEAVSLVREQGGTIGFLPSVCPETWCYALSTLWRSGLDVLAFDLGTQAERITKSKAGWLLPLGFPPARINDALVSRGYEALQRHSAPIRQATDEEPHVSIA